MCFHSQNEPQPQTHLVKLKFEGNFYKKTCVFIVKLKLICLSASSAQPATLASPAQPSSAQPSPPWPSSAQPALASWPEVAEPAQLSPAHPGQPSPARGFPLSLGSNLNRQNHAQHRVCLDRVCVVECVLSVNKTYPIKTYPMLGVDLHGSNSEISSFWLLGWAGQGGWLG